MNTKYYAEPLWDLRPNEFEDEVGEVVEFEIEVPVYPNGDANEPQSGTETVTVIAPKGYELTDADHARIGELVS